MNKVVAIASANSRTNMHIVQEGRNRGQVIDLTNGRKNKAVIFTDSGHIILAALTPETISGRLQVSRGGSGLRSEQDKGKGEL